MASKGETLRTLDYRRNEDSLHYHLIGSHRNDRFPWELSEKMVQEMDSRDMSALKDIVRMAKHGS